MNCKECIQDGHPNCYHPASSVRVYPSITPVTDVIKGLFLLIGVCFLLVIFVLGIFTLIASLGIGVTL